MLEAPRAKGCLSVTASFTVLWLFLLVSGAFVVYAHLDNPDRYRWWELIGVPLMKVVCLAERRVPFCAAASAAVLGGYAVLLLWMYRLAGRVAAPSVRWASRLVLVVIAIVVFILGITCSM